MPVPLATVPELFAARVAAAPGAPAVTHAGTTWTYADLDARANRLARLLAACGAGPERRVALLLPRSADLLVAVLAVLKASGAYVPVDPAYPADRIALVLRDADPAVVLTDGATAATVPDTLAPVLVLLDQLDLTTGDAAPPAGPGPLPDHPAYVIHTSGATGRPKGVVTTHRGVVNLAADVERRFGADRFGHVLAAASLSFDLSVFELLVPLLLGGGVEVVTDLLELADRGGWSGSLLSAVPSALASLLDRPGGVRLDVDEVVLAGETLPAALVERLRRAAPGAAVANIYGPTEITVYVTAWRGEPGEPVRVGRPVANAGLLVLDARLRRVPPASCTSPARAWRAATTPAPR